ncbi:MAG: hypothetical protein MI866_03940, partial [Bacteroidales bacterium]|nr:hypothetical protein [Bacteroidales bacterium]
MKFYYLTNLNNLRFWILLLSFGWYCNSEGYAQNKKCLHNGKVEEGMTYTFDFTSHNSGSTIYFYRII